MTSLSSSECNFFCENNINKRFKVKNNVLKQNKSKSNATETVIIAMISISHLKRYDMMDFVNEIITISLQLIKNTQFINF